MMMASEKKVAPCCLVLVLVHPWGQAWIVVFPWGWILLHRHCGPGDDDIIEDDEYDDSVLPKDCILYLPGAGFYCIGIVGAMMIMMILLIMMIVSYPKIVYYISLGLDSIASG